MAIPKHDEIRVPALNLLNKNQTLKLRGFLEPLALHFNLSDAEINEEYTSGNGQIFYDRISWALSYLNMAGLVEKPKRGTYKLSKKGLSLLKSPEKIDDYINNKLQKREPSKLQKKDTHSQINFETSNSELTPLEELYSSVKNIQKSVYLEIINTILTKTPIAFERLVILLLQRMGYGGELKDAGFVTQASNDGGIDGIIKEDVLGFGRIHIQAKRYKTENGIGREEIQKFVGALAVAQSNKGVFITTSYYTKGAIEYAKNLNGTTNVVLIDGKQLAKYIYDYGLGMQIEQTIKIKKLDSEFWDSFKDEK